MVNISELEQGCVVFDQKVLNKRLFTNTPLKLNIQTLNFTFETLYVPYENSNELFILLSAGGRVDDSTRFDRWSLSGYSEKNIICIEDPMYKLHRLTTGWYFGSKDFSAINELKPILDKVIYDLQIKYEKVTIIGSSCGGYAALYLSRMINGCKCIAMNPQIIISNWGKSSATLERKLNMSLFEDSLERNDISDVAADRSSKYFLMCNINVERDWDQQLKILFDKLAPTKQADNVYAKDNFVFYLSDNVYTRPHTNVVNSLGLILISNFLSDSCLNYSSIQSLMKLQEKEWEICDNYVNLQSWSELLASVDLGINFGYPKFEKNVATFKSFNTLIKMSVKALKKNTKLVVSLSFFAHNSVLDNFIDEFQKKLEKFFHKKEITTLISDDNHCKFTIENNIKKVFIACLGFINFFISENNYTIKKGIEEDSATLNNYSHNDKSLNSDIVDIFQNKVFTKFANYNNLFEFRNSFRLNDSIFNKDNVQKFSIQDLSGYIKGEACIDVHDVQFRTFLFDSVTKCKKLYISLSSGKRKEGQDVLFTRWKWRNYFDGYFLAIDDPMFAYYKKFPRNLQGWFYGTKDNNFLDKTADLITEIARSKGIKTEDITLIGSSSGGTAALYLSNKIIGASIIAYNPQIHLVEWPSGKVFEKVTNIDLRAEDERNFIKINKNSSCRYFIYYNMLSGSDMQQIKHLFYELGVSIDAIKYGINKISDNIYIFASVVNSYNYHTSQPNDYETFVISKFLDSDELNKEKVINSGVFYLLGESISTRYELLTEVRRHRTSKNKFVEQALNYVSESLNNHIEQQKYKDILDDFKFVFSLGGYGLSSYYFKNAVLALKKMEYAGPQISEYFAQCYTEIIERTENIANVLKKRNFNISDLLGEYIMIVDSLFSNTSVSSCYKRAFLNICNALQDNWEHGEHNHNFCDSNINYAVLSNEINCNNKELYVNTLTHENYLCASDSCSIIGYNTGVVGFVNKDSFNHVIDFFFRNLLGCYKFRSIAQYKQNREAYVYTHTIKNQLKYAMQVERISTILANIIVNKDNENEIQNLCSELIRLVYIAMDLPNDRFVVFTNFASQKMESCSSYFNFIDEETLSMCLSKKSQ